jgi:hypothetical protein
MRKFYQREQLNNHMETHGEPVDCPWSGCGKRINRASLSNHYRAHKMESQLRCNVCDKLFSSKPQLTVHQETHQAPVPQNKLILSSQLAAAHTMSIPVRKQLLATQAATQHSRGYLHTNTAHAIHHSQSRQPSLPQKAVSNQVSTTLISITTPSAQQQTQVHHSTAQRNQRAFVSRSSNFNNYAHMKSPNRNRPEKPEKITCCACNQVFTNTNDLSFHQCVVPVVTITGPKDANLANLLGQDKTSEPTDSKDDADNDVFDLTTPMPANADVVRAVQKSAPDPIVQRPSSVFNHGRSTETLSKHHHDIPNRMKRSYGTASRHRNYKQVDAPMLQLQSHMNHHSQHKLPQSQQQHFLIETPGHPPQLILADADTLQLDPEQLQALLLGQQQSETLQEQQQRQQQQRQAEQEQAEQAAAEEALMDLESEQIAAVQAAEKLAEQAALEGGQLIMIQHPDGQCVQICVPEGMDIDEVLKSLNQNWPLDQAMSESGDQSNALESKTSDREATDQYEPPLIELEADEPEPMEQPSQSQPESELIEQVHLIEEDSSQIFLTTEADPNAIDAIDESRQEQEEAQLIETDMSQAFDDPATFDTNQEEQDLLAVDSIDGQTIELDGQQLLTAEQAAQLLELADQQHFTLDPSMLSMADGQMQEGEQQLIYLPVNEDGTCAIDAASFAMLTCNGDMPIIVSSESQLPAS